MTTPVADRGRLEEPARLRVVLLQEREVSHLHRRRPPRFGRLGILPRPLDRFRQDLAAFLQPPFPQELHGVGAPRRLVLRVGLQQRAQDLFPFGDAALLEEDLREQPPDRAVLRTPGREIASPPLGFFEPSGPREVEGDPLGHVGVLGILFLETAQELEGFLEAVRVLVEVDERRERLAILRVPFEKGAIRLFRLAQAAALRAGLGSEAQEPGLASPFGQLVENSRRFRGAASRHQRAGERDDRARITRREL